jgi:hypothetical protein
MGIPTGWLSIYYGLILILQSVDSKMRLFYSATAALRSPHFTSAGEDGGLKLVRTFYSTALTVFRTLVKRR